MLSGHCTQIDTIWILSIHTLPIALVISEAVFHTDDDPSGWSMGHSKHNSESSAHHKLVKTTPNPKATKKSSGELGPFPELPELPVGEAGGVAVVVEIKLVVVADILAGMMSVQLKEIND
jgi:hypothetical protein